MALMRRMGWLGPDVPTLEVAGKELGLTRERVRQLAVKLLKLLRRTRPSSDAFDAAAAVLEAAPAAAWMSPGAALFAAGLTDGEMPDEGIANLFALLGRAEVAHAYARRAKSTLPVRKAVIRAGKSLARSVGVSCVEWVALTAELDDVDHVRTILFQQPWCVFLDADWYWNPSVRRGWNRTENVTDKMLAACGPLSISDLRDGLDRVHRYRAGKMPYVPSPFALRLFYATHPRYVLGPNDIVSSKEPLDPAVELDRTEMKLYAVLSVVPSGVLDRSELIRHGIAAGINQNSLSVYTSYSPILANPVMDRWTLRGKRVSPAVLDQARQPRRTRFHAEDWLASGALRVRREVGTTWGLVIAVPRAYVRLLASLTFTALNPLGEVVGQVRFNDTGTSWGYSPFLQAAGAEEGDVVIADFDLSSRTCRLSLEPSAIGIIEGGVDE
jgi:hypothetical protein